MVEQTRPNSALKKTSKMSASIEKRVSFSNLVVYEFLVEIGDNPSCEGAPLCLGPECQGRSVHDVSSYEAKKRRRDRKKLTLSASKRSKLLMGLGYSMEEVVTAALASQTIRQQRIDSMEKHTWDKFTFVLGSATRRLKKMVGKAGLGAAAPTTVVSPSA